METAKHINATDFLAEDPMKLSWKNLVKILRGQVPWPIAVALATVLKVVKLLGGGSALNAGARESYPIEFNRIPLLGRNAFESLKPQLPDFEFIRFSKREIIGMRQEYGALALHRDRQTMAICQWQQHLIVLPADKMSDERDKSTESLTTEFVSIEGDRPIVTLCLPKEHMGAADLYGEGIAEIAVFSNEERMESILEKHFARLRNRGVNFMDVETAIAEADDYGNQIRDHFMALGLLREVTDAEVNKILKEAKKHEDRFAKYRVV